APLAAGGLLAPGVEGGGGGGGPRAGGGRGPGSATHQSAPGLLTSAAGGIRLAQTTAASSRPGRRRLVHLRGHEGGAGEEDGISSRPAQPSGHVSSPGRTLAWLLALATILALLIVASPSASWAQVMTGTLLGTVTDAQGAGIPGATVNAIATGTNISRNAQT